MYYATRDIDFNITPEERYDVHVFKSKRQRDDWVESSPVKAYSLTRQEAARIMRRVMEAAYGGRQSGYEALAHIAPSETTEQPST